MRTFRKAVAVGLPIMGMVLVFLAILLPSISLDLQIQILVVLVGILMIEAGVWRLTAKILPNERQFLALRAEVDAFIGLVRNLNNQGVALQAGETPEVRGRFEEAKAAIHASVDRMGEVAGKTPETF